MSVSVSSAPPFLTVQDLGRPGYRAQGVPSGGAMDFFSLSVVNIVAGNPASSAALEWALGGGSLIFQHDIVFVIGGAECDATLEGRSVVPYTATVATAGETLTIGGLHSARFLYIAFAGGIDVPLVLGSRSTYLPARFGGLEGRLIRKGDVLGVGEGSGDIRRALHTAEGAHGSVRANFSLPKELLPNYRRRRLRIVPGPEAHLFGTEARAQFHGNAFRISLSSDRTGFRLDGHALENPPQNLPSAASCPGTVQVPPLGLPIVLMADSPTVGGYPRIGVVAACDIPILAQAPPGAEVTFEPIAIEESQRLMRRMASSIHTIRALAAASRI